MLLGKWCVYVCVCVLLPLRLIRQGPSAIVMKVLVIKAQGAFKRVGRQSAYDVRLCAARVRPDPLTDQRGSIDLWGNRRLSTGYSLYMGLGDLFIEILI
jgi:hypothetical protein